MKSYRQIIKDCFGSIKKISVISIILMLLLHTGYLLMPKYLAQITQSILGGDSSVLRQTALILGVIILTTVLIERAENILADYILSKLEVIRTIYYRFKLLGLSYSQITSEGSGKIISKMNKGVNAEIQIYRSIIRIIIVVGFRGVVILRIVLSQYPQAILPVSIIVIILALFQYRASSKVDPITNIQSDVRELSSRNMVRQIQEWLLVRIHNKQQHEQVSDQTIYKHYASNETKIAAYNYTIYDILHLGFRLGEVIITFYIGHLVMDGTVGYEEITEIVTYMWFFRWPLDVAINRFMIINKESSYYTKLYQFAHQTPEIINGSLPYQYRNGTIQFSKVGFGYSDNPSDSIFDGLDLTIPGGAKIALVGHSGSGKSTIIKLLLRLYDIGSGQIMIDDQDISQLDIATLYDHIGYLTQEPSIFDGSIRENLEYGQQNMKQGQDSDLWQALEYAQLDNLIRGLDSGLDTQIGERGIKLSGGERQRLAIARIFLRNPDILILDEPTAALDSISEHKITEIIDTMMQHKTVIIIAHRLQTVMHADRIIVMDGGQIIQTGTHTELLAQPGLYQTLVNLQSGLIEE